MLSTFIKLPFAINTFVLSIFEWPLKTGFTVILLSGRLFSSMQIVKTLMKCHFYVAFHLGLICFSVYHYTYLWGASKQQRVMLFFKCEYPAIQWV